MVKDVVGSMTKCLVSGTSLVKTPKRLSNHSMRKTTIKKLKVADVAESSMIKITGHPFTAGLRSYYPGDQCEFRGMSNAIDSYFCHARNSTEPAVGSSITSSSYNQGNYVFHNFQVTFNTNKVTQSVTSGKLKLVIYSDESSQSQ